MTLHCHVIQDERDAFTNELIACYVANRTFVYVLPLATDSSNGDRENSAALHEHLKQLVDIKTKAAVSRTEFCLFHKSETPRRLCHFVLS